MCLLISAGDYSYLNTVGLGLGSVPGSIVNPGVNTEETYSKIKYGTSCQGKFCPTNSHCENGVCECNAGFNGSPETGCECK